MELGKVSQTSGYMGLGDKLTRSILIVMNLLENYNQKVIINTKMLLKNKNPKITLKIDTIISNTSEF